MASGENIVAMASSNSSPGAIPRTSSASSPTSIDLTTLFAPPFFFAPFNRLHERNLLVAEPLGKDPVVWFCYAILPTLCLLVQAYLILTPGTRKHRRAMGAVTIGVMWGAWTSWRFHEFEFNAFNCGITIVFIHLAIKAIEWTLLEHHLVDPRMAAGRPKLVAAMDLCMNSRLLGLGAMGLDTLAGPPNATLKAVHIERHLPKPSGRPTSRLGAIARHMVWVIGYYLFMDALLATFRRVGGPLLLPGPVGAVKAYSYSSRFIMFPGVLDIEPYPFLVAYAVQACVPGIICGGLQLGYHLAAVVCLSSTFWEVDSWDVDLFDGPWKAQSLIDLWGKRWHQLFRHQFVICSAATLWLLRLPNTPYLLFPLTFLFSGALHSLGELNMSSPVPQPFKLAAFFALTGVACMLEVVFKAITGKRVKGVAGRIWMWLFMFVVGRVAVDAWLDAGVAGCPLLPPGGPGEYVADWMLKYVFHEK